MLQNETVLRTSIRTCLLLLLLLGEPGGQYIFAQDEIEMETSPPPPSPPSSAPAAGTEGKAADKEMAPPKLPKTQEFTSAEVQKECRKYEGKFIAYYDKIYKVEKCKRREVLSTDDQPNPVLARAKIQSVEGLTVATLPEGSPIEIERFTGKLNCLRLEGRYILSRGDDIYFIEKCKKRMIPDWDTYAEHAQKRGKRGLEVFELAEAEFHAIKAGEPIKSVLDEEYKKLLAADKEPDIIPINEACKGLNGKYVTYYSRIYRIDACKKRPVDSEAFVMKNSNLKMIELSSEQWVSLPTGKIYKP